MPVPAAPRMRPEEAYDHEAPTCHVADRTLASQSFNVNVRLANVLGRRIDGNSNNPLVPGVMCRMLWESVAE